MRVHNVVVEVEQEYIRPGHRAHHRTHEASSHGTTPHRNRGFRKRAAKRKTPISVATLKRRHLPAACRGSQSLQKEASNYHGIFRFSHRIVATMTVKAVGQHAAFGNFCTNMIRKLTEKIKRIACCFWSLLENFGYSRENHTPQAFVLLFCPLD